MAGSSSNQSDQDRITPWGRRWLPKVTGSAEAPCRLSKSGPVGRCPHGYQQPQHETFLALIEDAFQRLLDPLHLPEPPPPASQETWGKA